MHTSDARERTIKVDAATDRAIGDLAHFLARTKKSVVREAVRSFIDERRSALAAGLATANARIEAASARDAPRDERAAFRALPFEQRLALQRDALIEEFAELRATNVRRLVVAESASDERTDSDERTEDERVYPVLVVDTEIADGASMFTELEVAAKRLLGEPIEVRSTTPIRLFRKHELRALLDAATPI